MNKKKAIVLKTKGKYMYVATEDRQFLNLPKPSKTIVPGQEVMVDPSAKSKFNYKLAAFAAVLFLMIMTGSLYTFFAPTEEASAYISVDINPSLELAVDSNNKVLDIIPYNPEAEQFKQKMNYKGLDFRTALTNLITTAEALGYLSQDIENLIFITVVNVDDNEEVAETNYHSIRQDIFTTLEQIELPGNIAIQKGSLKDRAEAQDQNRSVNEFILEEKLAQRDDVPKRPFDELRGKELVDKLEEQGIPKNELFDELTQMRGRAGQKPDAPHDFEPGQQPFEKPVGPSTDPPALERKPERSTEDDKRDKPGEDQGPPEEIGPEDRGPDESRQERSGPEGVPPEDKGNPSEDQAPEQDHIQDDKPNNPKN